MNIEQSSKEQKLKALIEDMGVGSRQKAFKADMAVKLYPQFTDITYDEAMSLVKDNNDTLEHTSVFDPAWEYLANQRNQMLKWAGIQNDTKVLGRHDHEFPVHALVSIDDVTVEVNFYIPRLYYSKDRREDIIRSVLLEKINQSSEWSYGLRRQKNIEFVEL